MTIRDDAVAMLSDPGVPGGAPTVRVEKLTELLGELTPADRGRVRLVVIPSQGGLNWDDRKGRKGGCRRIARSSRGKYEIWAVWDPSILTSLT